MVKKIYLGIVFALFLMSMFVLAEDFLPAVILEGQEVFNLGYKHSNYSNIITSTKPYISCIWKPDAVDDGWKSCEAIFEIENQNAIKPILNNPAIQFSFEKEVIKNKTVMYSNQFNLVPETYTDIIVQEGMDGKLEAVEQIHTFTKKKFYGFTKTPAQIDTSKPFAIKISYEAPKYSDNQFTFSLSGQNFQAYIDPDQSACGTLDTTGAIYTLTQKINSSGTCFTIGVNNIVLDCKGYLINYSIGGTLGYGVGNIGFDNVTIKNCNIQEGNISTSYKHGVYFNHAANGTILNNTITIISALSNGMFLNNQSDFTNIFGNNVTTSGSTANGIRLMNSSSSSLSNNVVTTGAVGAPGIELRTASNFNILNNNTIITTGNGGYGIYLRMNSGDNLLLNNHLSANYINNPEIYDLTGSGYINYLVYNNSYGEIRWINTSDNGLLKDMDLDGEIGLGYNLFIGNNTIALNTSAFGSNSKINSSANFTLKNLNFGFVDQIKRQGGYNTDSLEIVNNGANCLGTSCALFSYTNGVLLFNTTSFSSFAVDGLLEVDIYNTSLLFTNQSHYSAFRFFMRNVAIYPNTFNWFFDTSENVVQSTLPTNLTLNENIFIFVEHTYSSSGQKTVMANGTTGTDSDLEQIVGNIE